MLEIRERTNEALDGTLRLVLPFDQRQRSRLRVQLSSGETAALLLPRGTVLRGGDALRLSDGRTVLVQAEPETVSTVRSGDARGLARAAYHLGNRHVALEVGDGYVRYQHDHVLDGMVRALGLHVEVEEAAFEPEGGAYERGRPHAHSHSHSHGHAHAHSHSHEHAHEDEDGHGHGHVYVYGGERGRDGDG